ncbi:phosphopantetheine-binding protein [Acinetobacter larvae]|nr:phosphopantetheine-binding protein [Acinetobacter larvae]
MKQLEAVLAVDIEQIEADDNLIAHGLDSLAIMQIVDVFEKKYKKPLQYVDFAMSPTLQDWQALIQTALQTDQIDQTDTASTVIATWTCPSETVPLSAMQYASWAGRQSEGIAAHLYLELKGQHIDVAQLQRAYQLLRQRHPMLNVAIANAQQHIPSIQQSTLQVEDWRDQSTAQSCVLLSKKRQRLSHQQLAVAAAQVFELQLSLLPEQQYVLHIDSDMTAIDPPSLRIVLEDLAMLYRQQQQIEDLDPMPTGDVASVDQAAGRVLYFDYLQQQQQPEFLQAVSQDQQWWREHLHEITAVPRLPYLVDGLRHDARQFDRLVHQFDPADRVKLQQLCTAQQLDVETVLLTLFAKTIAFWSGCQPFRLNLPRFKHFDGGVSGARVVGDFSQFDLLRVDFSQSASLAEAIQTLAQTRQILAQHDAYTGIDVLRDLSKHHQQQESAPIVFSSMLDIGELFSTSVQQSLGQPIWCISQGPKVDLDAQVAYYNQGLVVNWDIRRQAFLPKVAAAMFDHYIASIQKLLRDGVAMLEQAWSFRLDSTQMMARAQQSPALLQLWAEKMPNTATTQQFRVCQGALMDCPDWVIGRLYVKSIAALQQHGAASLEVTQTDSIDQSQLDLSTRTWVDTGYQAYFDDQSTLHIYFEPSSLWQKNGYWVDAQLLQSALENIAGVRAARVGQLSLAGQQHCVALFCCDATAQLSLAYLQEAYRQRFATSLWPTRSYVLEPDQVSVAELQQIDLTAWCSSHLALEQLAQQAVRMSPVQHAVFLLMAHVLGQPVNKPDLNFDFFDQGGDSLLAIHFVAALNQYFKNCQINIIDVFQLRTVQRFAAHIEEKLPQRAEHIAKIFCSMLEHAS